MDDRTGFILTSKEDPTFSGLVGQRLSNEELEDLIKVYGLRHLYLGQNDKITFLEGSREQDVCLRFEEEITDECDVWHYLTDIFHCPEYYTRTDEEMAELGRRREEFGRRLKEHMADIMRQHQEWIQGKNN